MAFGLGLQRSLLRLQGRRFGNSLRLYRDGTAGVKWRRPVVETAVLTPPERKAEVPASRDLHLQVTSITLPSQLIERVRTLGFNEDLSTSSIVEQALLLLLDGLTDEQIAHRLRDRGASLRRS